MYVNVIAFEIRGIHRLNIFFSIYFTSHVITECQNEPNLKEINLFQSNTKNFYIIQMKMD